jgi:hypothetical protein
VSRRTEEDDARDLLAALNSLAFRICEFVPKEDANYLEGADAKEWAPIDDKRAARLLAMLLMQVARLQ